MPRSDPSARSSATRLFGLLATVVFVAALYFGREFFVPLALAVLLSFLLAPVVNRLERWRLGRVGSVVAVCILGVGVVLFLGWVVAGQVWDLAQELPGYKDEIASKIVRISPKRGSLDRLMEIPQEVEQKVRHSATQPATEPVKELAAQQLAAQAKVARVPPPEQTANPATAPSVDNPLPVAVVQPSTSPLETLGQYLGMVLGPLGTAGIVLVFVIFFLLEREDLRDRMIRLAGQGQLNLTTKALDDAASRISRYLFAQAMVNGSYGLCIGVGLWVIGATLGDKPFPNVFLWGSLSAVLRFIPYIGPWLGAALPILLAFALFPGFHVFLAVLGLFVIVELINNNAMEPWLYGSSTGMSTVAVLVSAVFWTFLWGPVGLLMATPLTVCLVVLGKYVPQLQYLDILLGDEPAFEPPVRLYQRLLAEDTEEATDLIEEHLAKSSLIEVYDELMLPALAMAEADRHHGQLDEQRHRYIRQSLRELVDDLGETYLVAQRLQRDKDQAAATEARAKGEQEKESDSRSAADATATETDRNDSAIHIPEGAKLSIMCLPARDEADEIAGLMLTQILKLHDIDVINVSVTKLASEMVELVAEKQADLVCLSALPPSAVMHARYLCKRLNASNSQLNMVVGLWTAKGDLQRAKERIACQQQVRITNSFRGAIEQIEQMTHSILLQPGRREPETSSRSLTVGSGQ